MKRLIPVFFFSFFLYSFCAKGQCPDYAPVNWFDTTCYKYLPTQLKVGQGHLGLAELWGTTGARSFDFYIPADREEWAIAVVHAWQTERNILKYSKDVFNWHYYFGTLMKESFCGCDPNLTYSGITRCDGSALVNPVTSTTDYNANTNPGGPARVDGCFQIDHSTGWPNFPKYYPNRWTNYSQFTTFIAEDNFSTAALAKMYYDLAFIRFVEYVKGSPVEQVLTTTPDNAAGSIWLARAYNKGYFDPGSLDVMGLAANRTEAMASSNWLALTQTPLLGYDYTIATSHVLKVLSNNFEGGWTRPWGGIGWTNTSDNQWHCWYDKPITWAKMTAYMNKFFPLYPEANVATVTAKVKAKFDAIHGGAPISFRYELAPVLDEFILNMPYDDPMQAWLYSTDGNSGCHKGTGCIGPDVKLKADGPTTFCNGLSVNLETVVGTGYTYQWLKNGANIADANASPNVFTATTSGTYAVQVTTSSGCMLQSDCEITVTVNNCSSCTMSATATSTNNTCTGVQDGSVNVSLTNGAFPVTYSWTGPVAGNTASMSNVPDGTYTVLVTKVSDPTCKAYAMVNINSTVALYQQINTTKTVVDCSTANLGAQVVSNPPSSCSYTIKLTYTGSDCYGSWDNSQLNIMASANGSPITLTAPRANGGGNCIHLSQIIQVPTGATLKVSLKEIPTWAITGPNFRLDVLNTSGTVVGTYSMNGVTYNTPSTDVITLTTNCGVALPNYTMSWTPTTELTVLTNTANNTTAKAVVSTTRTYTVWAQHPTLPACKMSKNITVDYTCPGGLPVEWIYFTASPNDNQVLLNWATASEINASVFELERSIDNIHYEHIGTVNAVGNTTEAHEYRFLDGMPYGGISYYRIKQIDIDGTSHYSDIRAVNNLETASNYIIFPNPSTEDFQLSFNYNSEVVPVRIQILSVAGQVLQQNQITLSPGSHYSFGEDLPSGIYLLKIGDVSTEHTYKLIKE
ncbi:MAG: hypothetical protein JWO58_2257 [Chitinophagaceae bacterium]|nr:hypothetical protein [Chitinophagaceae bacterium]